MLVDEAGLRLLLLLSEGGAGFNIDFRLIRTSVVATSLGEGLGAAVCRFEVAGMLLLDMEPRVRTATDST
jgi:hypothetical protein